MNLKKWGFIYLPAAANVLAIAALVFSLMNHIPVKPIIYIIIVLMSFLIYLGIKDEMKR